MTVPARFVIVDVFAREPLAGNALAVFPDPGSVGPERMQRVAREMNLSETTFVARVNENGYDVRIFTPAEELPFAGHPTLGTAWTLRHLGILSRDAVTQRSAAGETPVTFDGKRVWLERRGEVGPDLDDVERTLAALDLDSACVGFDAALLGGASCELRPAIADAGVRQLMLPLDSPAEGRGAGGAILGPHPGRRLLFRRARMRTRKGAFLRARLRSLGGSSDGIRRSGVGPLSGDASGLARRGNRARL